MLPNPPQSYPVPIPPPQGGGPTDRSTSSGEGKQNIIGA
nr:MAG TPA: hypothetical protein [Caudoviricetes sp.]